MEGKPDGLGGLLGASAGHQGERSGGEDKNSAQHGGIVRGVQGNRVEVAIGWVRIGGVCISAWLKAGTPVAEAEINKATNRAAGIPL
jgi:hypothetical protein